MTVEHPPLVESAGGNVVGKTVTTKNTTVKSATNTAKRKLEQMILDSGIGEIVAYGNGKLKPFDRILARPECSNVLTFDAPVLPYQVGSVVHEKSATAEYGALEYRTTLKTTPVVDPSKIEVKSAEMRDV